jgi:hypothetical protein
MNVFFLLLFWGILFVGLFLILTDGHNGWPLAKHMLKRFKGIEGHPLQQLKRDQTSYFHELPREMISEIMKFIPSFENEYHIFCAKIERYSTLYKEQLRLGTPMRSIDIYHNIRVYNSLAKIVCVPNGITLILLFDTDYYYNTLPNIEPQFRYQGTPVIEYKQDTLMGIIKNSRHTETKYRLGNMKYAHIRLYYHASHKDGVFEITSNNHYFTTWADFSTHLKIVLKLATKVQKESGIKTTYASAYALVNKKKQ